MKCTAIQCKDVEREHVASVIKQMFKMASLCVNTSRETLSLFGSHLIDNCLLYARQDCTQMLRQLFFQIRKKNHLSGFFISFVKGQNPQNPNFGA